MLGQKLGSSFDLISGDLPYEMGVDPPCDLWGGVTEDHLDYLDRHSAREQ